MSTSRSTNEEILAVICAKGFLGRFMQSDNATLDDLAKEIVEKLPNDTIDLIWCIIDHAKNKKEIGAMVTRQCFKKIRFYGSIKEVASGELCVAQYAINKKDGSPNENVEYCASVLASRPHIVATLKNFDDIEIRTDEMVFL